MTRLLVYTASIFIFSVVGAVLPFLKRWKEDVLHEFIAFGAGVFLGAVFLHLLPDISADKGAFGYVLAGFLFVLLFEQFTTRHQDAGGASDRSHGHDVTGIVAFAGLAVHSLTAGLALGVGAFVDPKLGFVMFFAIVAHKAVEAFSLATVLRLSSFSSRKSALLLTAYAAMTPAGAIAAYFLMSDFGVAATQVPMALAAGTFLYVTTMDLLPEAFHVRARRGQSMLFLLLGLGVMVAISFLGA